MSAMQPPRGAAPVGYLSELCAVEAGVVRCLRSWSATRRDKDDMRRDLVSRLGQDRAEEALRLLDQICTLLARYGRRSLMRHQPGCKCLGGDESCFANFVMSASEGDTEDALLMATLLVRADVAPMAVSMASEFGLILKRLTLAERVWPREVGMRPAMVH